YQSIRRPVAASRLCQYQPESGREKLPPLCPSTTRSSTSPSTPVDAISVRSSVSSRASKLRATAFENCTMKTAPATTSAAALPPAAMRATRSESERVHIVLRLGVLRLAALRRGLLRTEPVAHAAHRLDR